MNKRSVTVVGTALFVAVVLTAGFLAWRVWDARRHTPTILVAIEQTATVRVRELPSDRLAVLLAVEDPGFRTHDGIDNVTLGQGRTTLSQSLGKLVYFDDFKPGPPDKLQLMMMTRFALEDLATKDQILEAFLNRAYFGQTPSGGLIGLDAAARHYFNVGWRSLTDDQYLALVALLVSPNTMAPDLLAAANAERVARIRRMIAGECRPSGVTDVLYESCAMGSRA